MISDRKEIAVLKKLMYHRGGEALSVLRHM